MNSGAFHLAHREIGAWLKLASAPTLLVDFNAKLALERLACCYGVTQRVMLARLLMQANRVAQQLAQEQSSDGQADYFDKCISLQWPGVTP